MNEPADDRDQQEHRGGQPVDIKSDRHLKAAGADPGIEREADWRALSDIDKRARSQHERPQYRRHGDPMGPVSDPMSEQAGHDYGVKPEHQHRGQQAAAVATSMNKQNNPCEHSKINVRQQPVT